MPSRSGRDGSPQAGRKRGWLGRLLKALGAMALLFAAALVIDGWRAFGKAPEGARLEAMRASPAWQDGTFHNAQPLHNDFWGMLSGVADKSDHSVPSGPVPTVAFDRKRFATPSPLRISWLGHSSIVIEIDGHRLLTDPVWGDRISPVSWVGPKRWYAPPVALDELAPLDAVLISHDHYDHLDHPTIEALKDWDTRFIVPLGVGAHLAYWGVPPDRIIELGWWERTRVGELDIVCMPARHASGRTLVDNDRTLWAGYALVGAQHRVYFSGDTGLFPALSDIGARFGPFDVTLIEVGAYGQAWPDWHLGPEQAVRAHRMLRGRLMIPIHWGLFDLAYHGWTEPAERTLAAAQAAGVHVAIPKPGEAIEPAHASRVPERWWPELSWQTAADYPIVATQVPPE